SISDSSHTNRNELLRSLIPTSIARVQHGRLINRLSPSARAGGPEKDSKRPIRRSSWVFFRLPRCTTITFSPLSASNGDLSEECFCSAASAYSYLSVCLFRFADYRCSASSHQLQRLVCPDDHVRPRHREQCLGSPPGRLALK